MNSNLKMKLASSLNFERINQPSYCLDISSQFITFVSTERSIVSSLQDNNAHASRSMILSPSEDLALYSRLKQHSDSCLFSMFQSTSFDL